MPYLSALRRMILAAGRRVGNADEHELAELLRLRQTLEDAIQSAVDGQLATGRSWAAIGLAAGMSRQGAFKQWGKRRVG